MFKNKAFIDSKYIIFLLSGIIIFQENKFWIIVFTLISLSAQYNIPQTQACHEKTLLQ